MSAREDDTDDAGKPRGTIAVPGLPGATVSWGARFSPHILVVLLTFAAAVPPLKGAIVSAVHWWWGDSYRQVDYVMDEARPNAGAPYIAGHLEGSTEQRNLVGRMQGATMVVNAKPDEPFAQGKRIAIWHSDAAPNAVVFGDEVNDVPVAALPKRPGLASFVGYAAWLVATLVIGFFATTMVAARWARHWGDLPIRRHR